MLHRTTVCACALAAAQAAPLLAQRRLHWDALEVRARLDAEGALHVTERHAMVFTGDWNGGERRFRVGPGQGLTLHRMSREDEAGAVRRMAEGGLDQVDHYARVDGNTVRWRSRRPQDPPFQDARRAYRLEYTLSGVVREQPGGGYRLDHDFGMPDREWPILRYALELEVDPAWEALGPVPSVRLGTMAPGTGYAVDLGLRYRGAGSPAAVAALRWPVRMGAVAALALAPLAGIAWLVRRERATGRLAGIATHHVNAAWLDRHLFPHPAEVVGAAWEEDIGGAEVGATIARMAREGKLRTEVRDGDRLRLRLLVDERTLRDHEKALVEKLFVGRETTDTDFIKSHYAGEGFDPSQVIRPWLEGQVRALLGEPARAWSAAHWLFLSAAVTAVVVAVLGARADPLWLVQCALFAGGMLVVFGMAGMLAARWRHRIDWGALRTLTFALPSALVLAVPAVLLLLPLRVDLPLTSVLGLALLALALWGATLLMARSRHGRQSLALRRRLTEARAFFSQELGKPQPALDDAWFPYVVAFGLDDQVSDWFKAHAAPSRGSAWSDVSHGSGRGSSSPSSGTPSWTGGGGSFGGAGASGSWVSALGALSTGVAAPSSSGGSSSGGGGGGGGSSSSGGGGGGGW